MTLVRRRVMSVVVAGLFAGMAFLSAAPDSQSQRAWHFPGGDGGFAIFASPDQAGTVLEQRGEAPRSRPASAPRLRRAL